MPAPSADVIETIEREIEAAAKEHFGPERRLDVTFNAELGRFEVNQVISVVAGDPPVGSLNEIGVETARRRGMDVSVGDELAFEIFYRAQDAAEANAQDEQYGDVLNVRGKRVAFAQVVTAILRHHLPQPPPASPDGPSGLRQALGMAMGAGRLVLSLIALIVVVVVVNAVLFVVQKGYHSGDEKRLGQMQDRLKLLSSGITAREENLKRFESDISAAEVEVHNCRQNDPACADAASNLERLVMEHRFEQTTYERSIVEYNAEVDRANALAKTITYHYVIPVPRLRRR